MRLWGGYVETIVPETHLEVFATTFAKFQKQGYLDGEECFIRRSDGSVRNVEIYGRMVGPEGDRISHCMVVDVTGFRRTEAALVESEERFRSLFELAPNPIVVHDGTQVVLANAAAAKFLGYKEAASLSGVAVSELVHPDTASEVASRVKRMMSEDWVAPLSEEKFLRSDGTVACGDTIASAFNMGGKRLIQVAAIDLAARHRIESALRDSEERFRALFETSADAIVVHDDRYVFFANPTALRLFGITDIAEVEGADIRSFIHPDSLELTEQLLRRRMAEPDAQVPPVELRLRRRGGSTWEAEATSSSFVLDGQVRLQTVFRDLTERKKTERELARYRAELERLVVERTSSLHRVRAELDAVTAVIGRTVELRDPYTAGHQRRVVELACEIAVRMGMGDDEVDRIRVAGAMHDIGKISVPAEILSKPGHFSDLEYELVKTHSQAGYDIISSAELDERIAEMVFQHHERLDGSGYPRGLTGDELLPGACVLMVADVVEAMVSHRPYRPAIGKDAALSEVSEGAGTRYDAAVVAACVAVFADGFEFASPE